MLYAVHYTDGETPGEIHQSNKVYYDDVKPYEDVLNNLGHSYLKLNSPGLLPPDRFFVDVKQQQLCDRPLMQIAVSKTQIKAGSTTDSAVLKGCPAGAKFDITTGGVSVFSGLLDGTEMEIFIPVPCIYRITLDFWPFQQFAVEIEATA